jgi:ribosome biogenesis GTPase
LSNCSGVGQAYDRGVPGFALDHWGASREDLAALEELKSAHGGAGIAGRVARVDRTEVRVVTESGSVRSSDGGHGPLCVGDWVLLDRAEGERHEVRAVLERRSALTRSGRAGAPPQTLAANVDEVMIVVALDQQLDPARLERFLTLAWDSRASPVMLLTKCDLGDTTTAVQALEAGGPGVPLIAVSTRSGAGLDELLSHLGPGRTAALVGSSGAGKSSLINALLGGELLPVGAVRARDGKGRHTTSWRELVAMPGGGAIIDTPGVRSLGLWLDEGGLDATFSDVLGYAEKCRFSDCSHTREPGCAVLAAIARGALDERRLESFSKLQRETEGVTRRHEARAASDESRKPAAAERDGRRPRPR